MCGALLLLSLVIRRRNMLTFGSPNRLLARMVAFVTIFVCVWILRAHEVFRCLCPPFHPINHMHEDLY
jgi:hypothetical protein